MKRVVVFGTFDFLHEGHLNFFKQAKKLGDYLIIVIARDKFVKKAKGKKPIHNEELRTSNLRKVKTADKVILGSQTHNFYRTLRTHKTDIIALGYDQKPTINQLQKDLKRHRLVVKIVRLKAYKPGVYKSSKFKS